MSQLSKTASALLFDGKGILAADETVSTLTKRFDALGISSTAASRRDYRHMLITTPGAADFLSGVILHDETIRQSDSSGTSMVDVCKKVGLVVGIKVDAGAKPLAARAPEQVTEGLDGLRERLAEYKKLGARFAKWRAVFAVTEMLPSAGCISANASALARYAALCQEQDILPIVEPEVLMYGRHTLERCDVVTSDVLQAVFAAMHEQGVRLEEMLLKPNMILPGDKCPETATVPTVAAATLRCMRRYVPVAVPGIVFLSGGQRDVTATEHLDAINRVGGAKPWRLTFSFGRALQDAALAAWRGKTENVPAAQGIFYRRARSNGLAAIGAYSEDDERYAGTPPPMRAVRAAP